MVIPGAGRCAPRGFGDDVGCRLGPHLLLKPEESPTWAPSRPSSRDDRWVIYRATRELACWWVAMNLSVLIDSIVRQVTVLIAQLATAGGVRAPVAHIANQVFVQLAREL